MMLGGGNTGKPSINDLRHPQYILNEENWEKYRLTYLGGSRFLKRYLKKFSRREDDRDFIERAAVSYVPAFAKLVINEVKNSIFQRMHDIARESTIKSYKDACLGQEGGVDLLGSRMNTFIGRDILPELLTMARVGIYVDMPPLSGPTLADKGPARPYLYWYKAEDIRSWALMEGQTGNPTELKALLLRDSTYDIDAHWVLPYDVTTRYRYLWIAEDGYVHAQFYQQDGEMIYPTGYADGEEIILPIKRIPFIMVELGDSLLADVADYQIAHLNLASSDMSYALKSNHPFYTEQIDMRSQNAYLKQPNTYSTTQTSVDPYTASVIVGAEKTKEIRTGVSQGRQYSIGTERPGFIAPPTDPLAISMVKQDRMKEEIRQLVSLAVSNITTKSQSADSKDRDNQGLEAGLSYIGLELEHAERKVADFWAMYEGEATIPTVHYPTNYSLLTDVDRQEQAKTLKELLPMVPSLTYRREIAKRIVNITIGTKVDKNTLKKIEDEIDKDPVVIGDPSVIEMDVVNGLVDAETASAARGYPPGCVPRAKAEHAERLATIAQHQSKPGLALMSDAGARGVTDASADPKSADKEKTVSQKQQDTRGEVKPRTRGKAD